MVTLDPPPVSPPLSTSSLPHPTKQSVATATIAIATRLFVLTKNLSEKAITPLCISIKVYFA
jgi:hypothetical protein